MKKLLITLLIFTQSAQAEDCTSKLSQCKLVIQDYKTQVDLLHQERDIIIKQRDQAAKEADKPRLPPFFVLLTGILVGSILTVYLKK